MKKLLFIAALFGAWYYWKKKTDEPVEETAQPVTLKSGLFGSLFSTIKTTETDKAADKIAWIEAQNAADGSNSGTPSGTSTGTGTAGPHSGAPALFTNVTAPKSAFQ